jgi:uncharacterized protein YjbI with pentapeptide repeats
LERIARDSERDHWPIMEILSAYIRENARYDPQNAPYRSDGSYDQEAHYRVLAADIEAILTVLRRRQRRYEKSNQRLNLHWADLHGAKLEGAHLQRVDLNEAYLWGANLDNAHLEGAQFMHSHLEGAQFSNSHLQGVDLRWAHLDEAVFSDTQLNGALMHGAHLDGTSLDGADLTLAQGLTQKQLDSAIGDTTTKLPPGLVMPDCWSQLT